MLIFGPYNCIPYSRDIVVYNYSSLTEHIPRMGLLVPPDVVQNMGEYELDVVYYNYIMNNDDLFILFMNIILPIYSGSDVYVCISKFGYNDYTNNMNESLIKMIQQRYGYNAAVINDISDLDYITPEDFSFSIQGLHNLDEDKKRLVIILESRRIQAGGRIYEPE